MISLAFISAFATVVAGQTAAECSVEGTKTISNQSEADSIAACPTFTGSISLTNAPPYSNISLNGIREITGTLSTHDWNNVKADSLERIGGTFENHDSYTVTLDFPNLSHVGAISFTESYEPRPGLQNILLPRLTTVSGNFTVTGNRFLSQFQTPNLQRVNGLKIINNLHLNNLTLPALETATPGGIDISGSFWDGVSLPSLLTATPTFSIVHRSPGNCSAFSALRAPGQPLAATEHYTCVRGCTYINSDGSCAAAPYIAATGTPSPSGSDDAAASDAPHLVGSRMSSTERSLSQGEWLAIELGAGIGGGVVVGCVVAGVLVWRLRRRERRRSGVRRGAGGRAAASSSSLFLSAAGGRKEHFERDEPPPPYEAAIAR